MSKRRYSTLQDIEKLQAKMFLHVDKVTAAATRMALDAAEVGAEAMRQKIDISGTGWGGRGPGDPRADSWDMRDKIVFANKKTVKTPTRTGNTSIRANFGYRLRSKKDKYAIYQDQGFSNPAKKNPSADGAPAGYTYGTNAFLEGWLAAREYLAHRVRTMRMK